jgi:hypothetical protein
VSVAPAFAAACAADPECPHKIGFQLTYFPDASLLAATLGGAIIPRDFAVPNATNGTLVTGYIQVSISLSV